MEATYHIVGEELHQTLLMHSEEGAYFDGKPHLRCGPASVTDRAVRAFEIYVALGEQRTLAKVSQLCAEQGQPIPIVTLKRWSSQYGWQKLVAEHTATVARQVFQRLGQTQAAERIDDLGVIRELKRRFTQRALLDPSDPTLTKAERQRAICPSIRDFALLLTLERQLSQAQIVSVDNPAQELPTPEDSAAIRELQAELLRERYGLPSPDRHDA